MKKITTLCLLFLLTGLVRAQHEQVNLQGNVLDAFLKNGIMDCRITLMRADSTEMDYEPKVYEVGADANKFTTVYEFFIPNRSGDYLVRVTKEGYGDGWGKVTVPANCKEKKIIVPTIYIRKNALMQQLGEAEVVATRIKVKMKGDTLVYDATAFNMPEGSMLQHLIEQLPGARMNEYGEIFINGRKIDELTLNSRTLFGGNKAVLLENLPYFTVKELKVFERHSLQSVLSKDFNAEKEYVMDVNLKDEYALGGIANADMAGGTHDRYLAKLFGFLLTKTMTVGAFANLNNVNDESNGLSGMWAQNTRWTWGGENRPFTRKGAGLSVNYQSAKKSYGFPNVRSSTEIYFNRIDGINEATDYKEFFLPTSTTYSRTVQKSSIKSTSFKLSQEFGCMPLGLSGHLSFIYNESNTNQSSTYSGWGGTDGSMRQWTDCKGNDKEYGLGFGNIFFFVPWVKNLSLLFNEIRAYRIERKGFSRQRSTGTQNSEYYRHEFQDAATTLYTFDPKITYKLPTWKRLETNLRLLYKITRKKSTDNLFVLSDLEGWGMEDSVKLDLIPSTKEMLWRAYDPVNSSFSNSRTQEGEFMPTINLTPEKKMPLEARLQLPLYLKNERLTYRRNTLDTLATRNMLSLIPTLRLKYKDLVLNLSFRTSSPGLMNMMPFRDDRNPLYIVEGNPGLKNNQQFQTSFEWRHKVQDKAVLKRNMRLASDFTYFARSVAQSVTYGAQTMAYTYRPENVRGNWTWNASHLMSFALGSEQLWWIDNEMRANVWHSVDFASVDGLDEAQLNRVETVRPGETLKIRYAGKSTKATLTGDVSWRRSWGHRPAQETINTFDFSYGLTAQHTIDSWNTTFNVDAFMYSRRGYSSSAMNRDECVVNAGVSQPFFHGQLTLKMEGRDIFNQRSATAYEINAQGRTESWHRILPSYIMLHAVYHFNRKPKY